jgi:hypothetical protein
MERLAIPPQVTTSEAGEPASGQIHDRFAKKVQGDGWAYIADDEFGDQAGNSRLRVLQRGRIQLRAFGVFAKLRHAFHEAYSARLS